VEPKREEVTLSGTGTGGVVVEGIDPPKRLVGGLVLLLPALLKGARTAGLVAVGVGVGIGVGVEVGNLPLVPPFGQVCPLCSPHRSSQTRQITEAL
jgi:hypothetical protein